MDVAGAVDELRPGDDQRQPAGGEPGGVLLGQRLAALVGVAGGQGGSFVVVRAGSLRHADWPQHPGAADVEHAQVGRRAPRPPCRVGRGQHVARSLGVDAAVGRLADPRPAQHPRGVDDPRRAIEQGVEAGRGGDVAAVERHGHTGQPRAVGAGQRQGVEFHPLGRQPPRHRPAHEARRPGQQHLHTLASAKNMFIRMRDLSMWASSRKGANGLLPCRSCRP